jgi:EmrB/QacA subfamily drug resistance transporter
LFTGAVPALTGLVTLPPVTAERPPDLSVEAPGVSEDSTVPWPLLLGQRVTSKAEDKGWYPWVVLATTLFGLLTVTFTITILAVSIPGIADDLGTTESTLAWVITGPLLAFAVVGPAVGKIGDRRGHRRVYLWGMAGGAVFAALSAVAWDAPSLIVFRVLGASLGAATGPASMALINTTFPRERRAQAMGYWTLVMAGGPVLGVVIGGPVVEHLSWRLIFVAQTPIALAGLLVAIVLLPDTDREEPAPFDLAGTLVLAAAVGGALLGLNRGPEMGWTHPVVVGGFVMAPILLAAFVRIERRAVDPLLPLHYLRRRNVGLPLVVMFTNNFAYMGGFIITPLLLNQVLEYGETRAGLLSIARPLCFSIAGPLAGYLTVRVGERRAATFGTLAIVASMIGLSTVSPVSSDLLIVAALALSGIGAGATLPAMAASVANAVEDRDLGVVGAAQQMVSQLGAVAGIQILQTVQASREASVGEVDAFGQAFLTGATVALFGTFCALAVRSSSHPTGFDARSKSGSAGR